MRRKAMRVAGLWWAVGACAVVGVEMGVAMQGVAQAASSMAPNKADSLYQSKGDAKRTYTFPPTGATLPYRTYVPTTWTPGTKLPLVLVLHGGGLDENAPFDRTPAPMKNELQKLAEEFDFIVVSPLGYSMSGGFGAAPPAGAPGGGGPAGPGGPRPAGAVGSTGPGAAGSAASRPPMPPRAPVDPKASEYSVQDVMNVVAIVEQEYGVDTSKEFITGNSMGAIGTMFIAAKYPEKFVAMAPSEGGFDPARYGKNEYKVKGALLIHKEDPKAPQVETESAEFVKILDAEGVDAHTISVPNTVHENVWFFSLPTTFHFFDKYVHPPVERAGPASR